MGRLPLCRLLLMNDHRYPWLILVPERDAVRELYELNDRDRRQLMEEVALVSRFIRDSFHCQKLNVAALGNVVPQLHVHVIGRRSDDFAWPKPVWGIGEAVPYEAAAAERMRALAAARLAQWTEAP
jgi:diadenosine tetraphosphate (Ap4A) HIT family hydrolase